jgi:hypothetical protein
MWRLRASPKKAATVVSSWADEEAGEGAIPVAIKDVATSYRGEIVILSEAWSAADQVAYAVGIGRLVDCWRLAGAQDDVSRRRGRPAGGGYAWQFAGVRRLAGVPVQCPERPGAGLLEVELATPSLPAPGPSADDVDALALELLGGAKVIAERVRWAEASLAQLGPSVDATALSATLLRVLQAMRDLDDQWVQMMTAADEIANAQSPPQKGSPRRDGPPALRLAPQPEPTRLDVVVVDDDPRLARGLARYLRRHHDVRLAHTAREALERIQAHPPDVLVCDYALGHETSEVLLGVVASSFPMVRRVLYSFSNAEVWLHLLRKGLIHSSIPKAGPQRDLLNAIEATQLTRRAG